MKAKHLWLLAASLFLSTIVLSQHQHKEGKDNLLFLLRQTEHISQALDTVEQLGQGRKTSLVPGSIVIIVCGEAVTTLGTATAAPWIAKLKQHPQVSILACGLSLKKFNRSETDLPEGIGYTENGFIKAVELQKEGYLSVEL